MYVYADRFSGTTTQDLIHSSGFRWFLFFLIHAPLFIVMFWVRPVATFHAAATFAIGLYCALGNKPHRVAYIAAYICGSEVLWRMAKAGVFWEFGKYATVALFVIALVRGGRWKMPALPVLYLAMLIPSALLVFTTEIPAEAGDVDRRELLSFNLSGPLALFVAAWFFSRLHLTREQLRKLFLMLISPVVGIGIYTLLSTLTAESIKWTGESNFTTSGGFGPNQVSNMLGLGALLAFIYLQDETAGRGAKVMMFAGMMFMAMQSAMTFSRGGLYNAAGGAVLAVFFLFRDGRSRFKIIFSILLFFVVAQNFLIPAMDDFTGGALTARFQNTDLTNRDEVAWGDFELWANSPIFGTGPGLSKWARVSEEGPAAAHTEFTRLVAEHGTFGFFAFLFLIGIAMQNIRKPQGIWHKALVAALLGWAFIFMMNAAMRLVAPSFILGLTALNLLQEEEAEPDEWEDLPYEPMPRTASPVGSLPG